MAGTHALDSANLKALSPLDGRYSSKTAPLREYLSEYSLIRYRVLVEISWARHLANEPKIKEFKPLDSQTEGELTALLQNFNLKDAVEVKNIEAETNHDVKAVEYFLREKWI